MAYASLSPCGGIAEQAPEEMRFSRALSALRNQSGPSPQELETDPTLTGPLFALTVGVAMEVYRRIPSLDPLGTA